jgi:hypothetical protein
LEEDSKRYYLKMEADKARNKLPSLPKIIDGVTYDTKDLKTRLLGETNIVSAKYVGERGIRQQRPQTTLPKRRRALLLL